MRICLGAASSWAVRRRCGGPRLPSEQSTKKDARMTPQAPAALLAAFGDRLTISAPELCRLLPLDDDTLRGHIKRGHIEYVQTGLGERSPRKAFTLAAVLRFLEERSVRECPPEPRLRASSPRRASDYECGGILARCARRQADKQRLRDQARKG